MARDENNRQGRHGEPLAVSQETPGPPVAISAEEERHRQLLLDGYHQLGQSSVRPPDDKSKALFGPKGGQQG